MRKRIKSILKLAAIVGLGLWGLRVVAQPASSPKMPTFYARRDYPGLFSYYVQVADTNGDGIPDLIAMRATGEIEVQLGNGDGTFRPGPNSSTLGSFLPFLATDLNGDGKIDLAIISYSGGIAVSLGNGDGTFPAGTLYPINDNLAYLVVGDFNGDGIPDIATAGNSGVWLLTGKGGGAFNAPVLAVSLPGCLNLAAADFNQDGRLDLVVTEQVSKAGLFAVLLGNGDGTFQPPQTFPVRTPGQPIPLAVGSLTEGGPPSIAVGDGYNDTIRLYFGNGKGGFSGPRLVTLPANNSGNAIGIGDINGDGRPDLVSNLGYVAYGIGGGHFGKPVSYPIEAADQVSNVALADLRRIGRIDIVTTAYFAISVLLNEGKGILEDGVWTSVTGGARCGAAADFNGDGKPDLAVNTSSGIAILLGTGKAAKPFTAGTPITLAGAGCPVTGDLNGDGIPDLLVPANGNPNALYAYLGNGDGTFTLKGSTATPNSGGYVVLADFNHDGKLDLRHLGQLAGAGQRRWHLSGAH